MRGGYEAPFGAERRDNAADAQATERPSGLGGLAAPGHARELVGVRQEVLRVAERRRKSFRSPLVARPEYVQARRDSARTGERHHFDEWICGEVPEHGESAGNVRCRIL